MMSGMAGMVAQGMAMGVGSSIGHKAVDGAMGMFSGSKEEAAPQEQQYAQAPSALPQAQAQSPRIEDGAACSDSQRELYQCLQDNNAQAAACQFYFDQFKSCQDNQQFQ